MKQYTQRTKVLGLEADRVTPEGDIFPAHVVAAAVRTPAEKLKIYYEDRVKTHVWGYVSGLEFDGKHITAIANFRHENAVELAMAVKRGDYIMAPLVTNKTNDKNEAYDMKIWGFQLVKVR